MSGESEIPMTKLPPTLSSEDQRGDCISTNRDDETLIHLGKKPVLKRNFGFMSMLGFSCTIMCTWEGVLLLFLVSFANGGYAGSIYGFLIVWLGNLAVFSTMGELASMAPTSGGQYHWVSMLAPSSCQKFLSYLVGWINVTAWQANVSAGGFLAGSLIQALIQLNAPDHVPQAWQTLLLFYVCIFFAVCINAFARKAMPALEALILVIHVLGFFAILIPLVYLAPIKTSSKDVFTLFLNDGVFGTKGLAIMVGLVGPVYSFLGADSAVHMSEEIQNASQLVPRTMILSITINGILGLSMLLATLFCVGNVEDIITFPFPFMAIFKGAAGTAGGTAMSSVVVILLMCALIAFVATASRMTWSFARDRGLPGWRHLSKVTTKSRVPLISIALTTLIALLLALIILGSSLAFNDVLSVTVSSLYLSYLIGNSLLLYRRLSGHIAPYNPTPQGLTNVGANGLTWGAWRIKEPWGTLVNGVGCVYLGVVGFFSFWPTKVNPGVQGMNYSSLMLGGVVLLASWWYWVRARRTYKGPVIEVM